MGLPANAVLLDRYRILKLLGAGGMGRVYLAEDQKLGMSVAIKVLRDILTQDPISIKRLITEAKTSILLAHPNILRLHNFEDGETAKFLVMEYVEGESLADKLAREGKLSEEETRRIAVEVCRGLEHAHLKKVIHRDMKPGNVMLGKDGSVKIADFGLARLCHDSIARMTSQLSTGTLQYMSPEQLDGEIGESSDLYALGVTIYEMLAGDPPFVTGEITAQIRNKVPRAIEGVSPEMNRIVLKCLEKKKENRFPSVQALREQLEGKADQQSNQKAAMSAELSQDGTKAFEQGKFVEAAAFWEQALALKPGDKDLTESLARARGRQSEVEAAGAAQRQAVEEADRKKKIEGDKTSRLDALKAKGTEAYNAGRYGEAIAAWQEALALSPGDADLSASVATARQKADLMIKEAESKKADEARKQWVDDIVGRANALFQKGTFREAENLLLQALRHVPDSTLLTQQLARIREKLVPNQGGGGGVYVPPVKPAKSRRKLWYIIGGVAAGIILLGIIGQLTSSSDVAGDWSYNLTAVGVNINGSLSISGPNDHLELHSQATYSAVGPDGYLHQVIENLTWEGKYDGQHLGASCTGGTVAWVGLSTTGPPANMTLELDISADKRSMSGQVAHMNGWGNITAQKQ